MKRILFLTQSPIEGAASRVRVYQYLPYLKKYGFDYKILSALSSAWFKKYYSRVNFSGKWAYFGGIFFKRLKHLLELEGYDAIFLQREILPYLPPFFERIIRKKAKRLIFDFDDAIHRSRIGGWLGEYNKKKIGRIISWCDFVVAGNENLASFARSYNSEVHVIPSAVDTQKYTPVSQGQRSVPILVWIGTPSSISNLKMLEPSLKALLSSRNFVFRIIGGVSNFSPDIPVENISWDLANEVEALQTADIGVMPLKDGEKERGKCGYKLLQYMACGLPVVASPVGVNREIVRENYNGFFAFRDEEWKTKLGMLLEDSALRISLGQQARFDVESRYSLHQILPKFADILQKAVS